MPPSPLDGRLLVAVSSYSAISSFISVTSSSSAVASSSSSRKGRDVRGGDRTVLTSQTLATQQQLRFKQTSRRVFAVHSNATAAAASISSAATTEVVTSTSTAAAAAAGTDIHRQLQELSDTCSVPGGERRSANFSTISSSSSTTTTTTTTTIHCQARQISVSYTRYMPATRRGGPIRSLSCGCGSPSSCCGRGGGTGGPSESCVERSASADVVALPSGRPGLGFHHHHHHHHHNHQQQQQLQQHQQQQQQLHHHHRLQHQHLFQHHQQHHQHQQQQHNHLHYHHHHPQQQQQQASVLAFVSPTSGHYGPESSRAVGPQQINICPSCSRLLRDSRPGGVGSSSSSAVQVGSSAVGASKASLSSTPAQDGKSTSGSDASGAASDQQPPLADRNSTASSAVASSASTASTASSATCPSKTSSSVSSPSVSSTSSAERAGGSEEVRTIWPNELAKRIARAAAVSRQSHRQEKHHRAVARCFEQARGDDAPEDGGAGAEVGGAGGPVIIDCRPFIEFNKSHIRGAVHINCTDKISRRRLQQGKVTVLDLLSARRAGGAPLGKERGDIVVYDDATSEPACVQPSQALHLVVESLRKEGREPLILKGGLSSFRQQHESLCASFLQPVDGSHGKAGGGPALPPLPSTPDIENAEISPILPFLFLGNEQDAQDLSKLHRLGIGLVLNVTAHLPLYHYERGGLRYKRLPASDSDKQNLRQYFEEAFEFIEDAHSRRQGLLVHCQAGVSRSATIVIAYLMKHTRMTMADAYKFVKGKRPIISPNLNFMGQLLEFEEDLNSGVTPRILKPKLPGLETVV